MKRWLPFIIVAAVALLALGWGGLLYRNHRQKVITLSKAQQEANRRESSHVRGNPKAPVTITEFGDFQCPPCGKLSEPLNQIESEFEQKAKLVFREFPLPTVHAHALAAAYAAEAAGLQGRFWEMHDILYREQERWSKVPVPEELFSGYAKVIGLDMTQFRKDMAGEEVKARVARDQKRGDDLGVSVTPTLFVNGKSMHGRVMDRESLRAAIEQELAKIPAR